MNVSEAIQYVGLLGCASFWGTVAVKALRPPFRSCALAVHGRPKEDRLMSLMWLTIGSSAVVVFYGLTGGTIRTLIGAEAPAPQAYLMGAFLGATVFCVSRIVAVTQNPGAMSAVSISCAVFAAYTLTALTASLLGAPGLLPIEAPDEGCLGPAVLFALCAWGLSELGLYLDRLLAPDGRRTTFGLVRQQIESHEVYERWHGETSSTSGMRHALAKVARRAGSEGRDLSIRWLSFYTPESMIEVVRHAQAEHKRAADGAGEKVDSSVRIVAMDDERNIATLQTCTTFDVRYVRRIGVRVLLCNADCAFLGVKTTSRHMAAFPEMVVHVDQPDRIAHLKSVFDTVWDDNPSAP